MKKIYVKGVFDLIHYGHIRFFEQAKRLGDFLTVGVSPDERATMMKRKPIFSASERAEVLKAIRFIDNVVENGPRIISKEYMLDNDFSFYVFGANSPQERAKRLGECAELPRAMVIELPYTKNISTTTIIEKINNY
jgi:glycerol-3-phosphate cytidylyltransferase